MRYSRHLRSQIDRVAACPGADLPGDSTHALLGTIACLHFAHRYFYSTRDAVWRSGWLAGHHPFWHLRVWHARWPDCCRVGESVHAVTGTNAIYDGNAGVPCSCAGSHCAEVGSASPAFCYEGRTRYFECHDCGLDSRVFPQSGRGSWGLLARDARAVDRTPLSATGS